MKYEPLIKWSGRKSKILDSIDACINSLDLNSPFTFHEPFLGSGAVFFHLKSRGIIKKSYLNDDLNELIYFYKVLKDEDIDKFYRKIKYKQNIYNEQKNYENKSLIYYQWREDYNKLISNGKITSLSNKDKIQVATYFYLLNRSCFNGIYRKNPKGLFNTPHGRTYRADGIKDNSINIAKKEDFTQIKTALKNTSLSSKDYKDRLKLVKEGDLVYLDPPYFDTVNYYGENSFTKSNHEELKEEMYRLIKLGAHVILSNSNSKECKKLYLSKYTYFKEIPVTRTVQRKKDLNSKAKYKEDKSELLITSIKVPGFTKGTKHNKPIKVVELFAGVGGFKLGLEKSLKYEVIWSNQWEPETKSQPASDIYKERFSPENEQHSNEDIFNVKVKDIPNHELLVGGFPCQDYSVATTLKHSGGLRGKKGVLWWSIEKILREKKNDKPKYLLLENVDRLIKSPSSQRGRDFAVMLKSLNDLGYAVEWRIINSSDYGMAQKRHRIYFLGYHKTSNIYKLMKLNNSKDWITKDGVLAEAFPVKSVDDEENFTIDGDLIKISKNFNKESKLTPFKNSGIMIEKKVSTLKTEPVYKGKKLTLGSILVKDKVDKEFYLDRKDLEQWKYLKGSKKIERKDSKGFKYMYSEGAMTFPDNINKPSRTIITGEGGSGPSRFKHVIKTNNKYRRLTPIELERLNMFPDNHTKLEGVGNSKRAFLMGNALVVGVVEKIGESLYKKIK